MNNLSYRVSISSGSLYHLPLSRFFALAAELEIDGVELVIGPECAVRGARSVRSLAAKHGVRLLSLHPPILSLPGWTRLATVTTLLADWASALEIPLVTLHTPRLASLASEPGKRYQELAHGLGERLRSGGAQLALENRARYSRGSGAECLDKPADLLALAQNWQAGITFDTAHAGTMCPDILAAHAILAPAVVNVHFSDLALAGKWPMTVWMETVLLHHQVPGSGTLPLRQLMDRLRSDQYTGLVTLELSPLASGLLNPWETRRTLCRCVNFVRGNLR